jgi:hypothetical protein
MGLFLLVLESEPSSLALNYIPSLAHVIMVTVMTLKQL